MGEEVEKLERVLWRLSRFADGEHAKTVYALPPSGSYDPLRQDILALISAFMAKLPAIATPAEESSEQVVWRRGFATLPEVGRKFIALYNDGSGAAMFWRHDNGFIDHDGDEYPAEKAWSSSFDAWAYLPDDLEFWCEARGDEPMSFTRPTAPTEARESSEHPAEVVGYRVRDKEGRAFFSCPQNEAYWRELHGYATEPLILAPAEARSEQAEGEA